MKVSGGSFKSEPEDLQDGHPAFQFYHPNKVAYQHGPQSAFAATVSSNYTN